MSKTKTTLTVRQKILNFLEKNNKHFTAKAITRATGCNHNTVRKELGSLFFNFKINHGIPSRNGYRTYRKAGIAQ